MLLVVLSALLFVDIVLRLRPLNAAHVGEHTSPIDVVSLQLRHKDENVTSLPPFTSPPDVTSLLSPTPASEAASRAESPAASPAAVSLRPSASETEVPSLLPTPPSTSVRPSVPRTPASSLKPKPVSASPSAHPSKVSTPAQTMKPHLPLIARDVRGRGTAHSRLLEHLLQSRTSGVLPPVPTRKPRCGPDTPGEWVVTGETSTWRYDGSKCVYSVASNYDFVTAFAGKRLLVVGDSASREFAVDTMRVLLGCSRFAPMRYSGGFGVEQAVGGAAGHAAAAACEKFQFDAGQASWADKNATVPVGGTGAVVDFRFHWLQWPSQIYNKWWWNSTIASGDFDAVIFNSYLHIVRVPTKDGLDSDRWYAREIDRLIAALDAAGSSNPAVAERLHKRFYWRASFPGEWLEPHYEEFKRERVKQMSTVAVAKMREAGYPVISLDKFWVPHASCDSTKKHCVTGDGTHPSAVTNIPMAWELWSIVADGMEDEAALAEGRR